MKTVVLYPNLSKPSFCEVVESIQKFLSNHQICVASSDELADQLGLKPMSQVDPSDLLAIIAIGGDGTILRLLKEFPSWNYPVLGVNLGSLGFMTDIPLSDLYLSLEDLLMGRYTIQKRMMLEVEVGEQHFLALNDACLHRGCQPGLSEMTLHIDDRFVGAFNADGLLLASPNGSTAYSLSAGGPIVMPTMECILFTPICPHTLSNRPLVISPQSRIQVTYIGRDATVDLSVDGFVVAKIEVAQSVFVSRSTRDFLWLHLERHDYYQTLRNKLGWNSQPRITPSR